MYVDLGPKFNIISVRHLKATNEDGEMIFPLEILNQKVHGRRHTTNTHTHTHTQTYKTIFSNVILIKRCCEMYF